MTAIVKARDAVDVVRAERSAELDTKVRCRNELELHFLVERAVAAAVLGEAAGGLALEFPLADLPDIGADHEAEDVLGIKSFRVGSERQHRCNAGDRSAQRPHPTPSFDFQTHRPRTTASGRTVGQSST
ncbi:hypothetical protein, partial [Burkholderia sp.]|uniref:hypothetical protein n=1 Tax=Burkholderia sp. TaxID=36773 RepID=UPI00258C91CC